MKKNIPGKLLLSAILFIAASLFFTVASAQQTSPWRLAYPGQSPQALCYEGSADLTPADQYESGVFHFSVNGPITYTINGVQSLSTANAGPLTGKICIDTTSSAFPLPGDSVLATFTCNYTITYSSPLSPLYPPRGIAPYATSVQQTPGTTWSCYGSASSPCFAGHTSPTQHTLVTETGIILFVFLVANDFKEVVLKPTDAIYREMKDPFPDSPLTGAPNRSQKGARIPSSIAPGGVADLTPQPNGKPTDMVGPVSTKKDGLSANTNKPKPGKNNAVGKITVKDLPADLEAVQDTADGHVSIRPKKEMKFEDYQKKLNSVPWKKD